MDAIKQKRIGLALGGGAARGLAHLGVLKVLARAGIPIDCVAGTSVGAIIGAAYCAGHDVTQLDAIAARIGWRALVSPVWPSQGFLSCKKMERFLVTLLGDLNFDELALPFIAVATDMETSQPVYLHEGRVAAAVCASCSVPGIFAPVKMNGRLLGDGGVSDNLPVAAARALGADYVIAVDVCQPTIRRRWGPLGVGFAALETLIQHAGSGIESADGLITPNLAGLSYVRFSQREELIARGAQAAEEKLPRIEAALHFFNHR